MVVGPLSPHDGEVLTSLRTGQTRVRAAVWPTTALLPDAAAALAGANLDALDLSGEHFPGELITRDEAASLARETELDSLTVDGITLQGATLAELVAELPNLTRLNLAGCDLDDAAVDSIVRARPGLTHLVLGTAEWRMGHRFSAPRLTGAVIAALAGLAQLRGLSLRDVAVDDDAICGSALWDRLEVLDLSRTAVGDDAARRLAESSTLRDLKIDDTEVGDAGAEALLARPWEALSLSGTSVSQATLLAAASARGLKRLGLARLSLDDGLAPLLDRTPDLEEIDLSGTGIGGAVLQALGRLPRLQSVKLDECALSGAEVIQLARAPLQHLTVRRSTLAAPGLAALAASPHLRTLALSVDWDWRGLEVLDARVDLEALAPRSGGPPPGLQQLWLGDTLTGPLTVELSKLADFRLLMTYGITPDVNFDQGFPRFNDLRAQSAGLTDDMLSALLRLPSMEALYISDNPYGEALREVTNTNIHTLELRGTGVDDAILASIARLPRLHCIDLPRCKVTAGGVEMLATVATNLQSIALDARQTAPESAKALANCRRLTEVWLYGPEVADATLELLARVRMRDLRLIDTRITDASVPVLAAIPGLTTLWLGNELSAAGLAALHRLRPDLTLRAERGPAMASRAMAGRSNALG